MTQIHYTSLLPVAEDHFVFPMSGSLGGIFFPRIFPMSSYASHRSGKDGALAGGVGASVEPRRVCLGWSEIKTSQVVGGTSRGSAGDGLHKIQAAAASGVLLLLDDGSGRRC